MKPTSVKNLAASIALIAVLSAGTAAAADADTLASRVSARDGWVGWREPMVEGAGEPCCFDWQRGHVATQATCDLDSRSWNIGRNDDDPRQVGSVDMDVYLHVGHGRVDKVRSYAATCPIRNPEQVRRLDGVSARSSIDLLAGLASQEDGDAVDAALASMALHADAAAAQRLAELSAPGHPRHLREQSLFWLGQARGAEGARIVERAATGDADPELRAEAVFALSQASGIDAYAAILGIARHDATEHVRSQALFWMAQMDDKRARDDIVAAIRNDTSDAVREQAVFALSQLKDDEADAALIALVRGDYPRKVKQQALFWLGQSGSTRALDFIDEVLGGSAAKPTHG
jgi:hypothetical protein